MEPSRHLYSRRAPSRARTVVWEEKRGSSIAQNLRLSSIKSQIHIMSVEDGEESRQVIAIRARRCGREKSFKILIAAITCFQPLFILK